MNTNRNLVFQTLDGESVLNSSMVMMMMGPSPIKSSVQATIMSSIKVYFIQSHGQNQRAIFTMIKQQLKYILLIKTSQA